MIRIEENRLIFDTKTQTLTFTDGCLTEIVSKLDGVRYLHNPQTKIVPVSLVFSFGRTLSLENVNDCRMETILFNEHTATVIFDGWYGHAELLLKEELQTGAVCITPSVQTSRPGVLGCRFAFSGLNPDLSVTIPYLQGFRTRLVDPILNWDMFKELRYPYRWEENFVAFGDERGGLSLHSEGSRARFKQLHLNADGMPFSAAIDTLNYGPTDNLRSAGGVTWKLNTYQGDWTVPVLSYRSVLMADPSWNLSKATLPDWFSDIRLAYSWCPTDPDLLDTIKRYIDPKKVLIHLPHWRKYKYDQQYPLYHSSADAKAFIEKGTEMGFHIAPHFNCYEIDPSLPEFELVRDFRYRDAEEHAVMGWGVRPDENGITRFGPAENNILLRDSRRFNTMTKIHPALPSWRTLLLRNIKQAVDENGLHMVFMDTSHNTHNLEQELLNDATTIQGIWDLLESIRSLNNVAIGGEGMNETLLCQHFAQGHSMYNGPEQQMIPVENYQPVNKILFGDLCHLIGYHSQKTPERRLMQDACDAKRGFLPTLLTNYLYNLEDPVVKAIFERATS